MSGDKAMDAGALALAVWYGKRVPHKMDEVAAEVVLQAAWPILSAGLRELCATHWEYQTRRAAKFGREGSDCTCEVCDVMRELDQIDKELGND